VAAGKCFDEDPTGRAFTILTTLCFDAFPKVRELAVFALGRLTQRNDKVIRDALASCLGDPFADVSREAIYGLASRRDQRSIAPLLRELRSNGLTSENLTAVAHIGDRRFIQFLYGRALGAQDMELYRMALMRSDPVTRHREARRIKRIASVLQRRLLRLAGDGTGPQIRIEGVESPYLVQPLVEGRSDGNVENAALNVWGDIVRVATQQAPEIHTNDVSA
jgi:hypothetical protein